jgi:hypothetical protein
VTDEPFFLTVAGVSAATAAEQLYEVALLLMLAMPAGTFAYVVSRIDR